MTSKKKPDDQSVTFLTPDDLVPIQAQLEAQAAQLAALETGAVELEHRVADQDTLLHDHEERLTVLEGADPGPPDPGEPSDVPPPDKAIWEEHMLHYGVIVGDYLSTHPYNLDWVYYDMGRVMYQIADYTGVAEPWNTYAKQAILWFRDRYVIPNGGAVPGYENFTRGLRLDYERTGDQVSKDTAILLSEKAMYALTTYDPTVGAGHARSREVAYAIWSYINAEALGEPPREQRPRRVDNAYDHIRQWREGVWVGTADEITPFTMAMTALALVDDWDTTQDARCLPAVQGLADWMWPQAWMPAQSALRYNINPGHPNGVSPTGAIDLNMLIAPWFSWLWVQTADDQYREKFDALLYGHKDAYLEKGKQFDQNYWLAFDGMRWREEGLA